MSCGSQSIFQIGGTGCWPLSVKDVDGNPVNADSTPVVNYMTVNGVGVDPTTTAYALTLTQVQDDTPAAVVGEYQVCLDPSAFNAGDIINVGVGATINGVTLTTVKDALIKDDANERPSIC